jgi:RIO-like serine/threonine protein kinase
MKLIRENKQKQRTVYFCGDRYRKVWGNISPEWIYRHVKLLDRVVPNFVISYGNDYIEYNVIEGTTANVFEHTDEFIKKIYQFCLDNIRSTKPWVHGDWSLSNIIIQPDGNMVMIDWDNLGMYREEDYMNKLHNDLTNAFGKAFQQHVRQSLVPSDYDHRQDLKIY